MGSFWGIGYEVKHAFGILQIGYRIWTEGMNHVRELQWITNKENFQIIAYEIPVAILCIKFDRKAARIAKGLWRVSAMNHGREPDKYRCLFACFLK
ncbi:hypothetical protein D3C73_1021110 [compost metagenome]